ncbi:MAG TPA: GNAT family protein [Drouetiella sp.]|jgi:RimJ/RimL family protein N-acetyltransferase
MTITGSQTLSLEVLARRNELPLRVNPVVLEHAYVRLTPIDVDAVGKTLFEISNGSPIKNSLGEVAPYDADEWIWKYMNNGPFADQSEFDAYLKALADNPNGLAMCVSDIPSKQLVGIATFMNNAPEHLKVELGSIWYSPIVQGKGYNLVATYLMLKHAFDLGYRRLEWKCNALNERSRRAALRMGFVFEGVQESHLIIKDRNRDTAWFRMLDREWADNRIKLEKMIALCR